MSDAKKLAEIKKVRMHKGLTLLWKKELENLLENDDRPRNWSDFLLPITSAVKKR